MNVSEFSQGFDILYNNISNNTAPGLEEFEKSFILTQAQEEILKNHINPAGNKYSAGIDGNAKRQIEFSDHGTTHYKSNYKHAKVMLND